MMPKPPHELQAHDHERNSSAERAYRVLQALIELGPGAHTLAEVMAHSGLTRSTAHRILQSGVRTHTFVQPTYGTYSIAHPSVTGHRQDALTELPASSPAISEELAHLQRRTNQVVALHSHLLLGMPSRICVDIADGKRHDFAAALATSNAGPVLRRAPLHHDAAGLVMLASLDDLSAGNAVLRRIKIQGYARTPSPVAGWEMLSVPLWRGSVLVGSVSLLAPDAYWQRRAERLADATMDTAAALSRRLEHTRTQRQIMPILQQAS
ncbi:helix-turn-helix domain-containing protein [Kitasatospora sp. NPDC091257]|uniref:helix-turn-helix domain-containing protein n=1 Tax=Kitasatospora sp. NPDC091257 TaxID=3364084 RepID=UPI003802593F